ncbi:MAG: type II toxin-antitoxin system VapC family toxin [Alphaproteobacteria bacterium]|nr:type II toxin-antitoxin system VapC family toxin [Alphaproteobacteria bacterium]
MILVDTNALIWFLEDEPSLGPQARRLIGEAHGDETLATSAFSFWETAMLMAKNRIAIDCPATEFRRRVLDAGVEEIAVTGGIGIAAVDLEGLHADPADRIIVATALAHDATLVTADQRLLAWNGPLKTHDARI